MSGRLVLFDFDGTLTHTDSTLHFARLLDRRCRRSRSTLIAWTLVAARFKCLTNHQLKHVFARLMLAGRTLLETSQLAEQFLIEELPELLDERVVDMLKRHAADGCQVHVVSGNFTVLLQPLRSRLPIAGIVATELTMDYGRLTGSLAGRSCHGKEKLRRAIEEFGREALENAIAYGDGRGDLPLLNFVQAGHLVTRPRKGQLVLRPLSQERLK